MKHTLIIATFALLLTACGGGGTSSDGGTSTGGPLLVTNTAGGQTDITGIWLACFPGVPGVSFDTSHAEIFYTDSRSLTVASHTSANGTCAGSGTGQSIPITYGQLVLQADITTAGWKDSTGTTVAPPLAQNGTTLPATPSATTLLITTNVLTGATATIARVVDATSPANIVMYDVTIDNINGSFVNTSPTFTKP